MQLLFLLSLNLLTIISWFRSGLINGGGDTGLPLYNPSLIASITRYSWWSGQQTGFSYPGLLSSFPSYLLLSLFQKIGFNPFALQVLFFFCMLTVSTTGMYFLCRYITKTSRIALFITLFFIVNPYTMINIWHRGSYNGMMMMVVIPWTVFLLFRTLLERKIRYSFLLAIISIFFAYSFNTPAFIATWWFLILATWVYLFITDALPKKKKIFYVTQIISFFFLWVGINLWWLLPFFHLAPQTLSVTTSQGGNIGSLQGVSGYFTLPYAFRGINTFYPFVQLDWGTIFVNPLFDLLSWVELGFVIVAFFHSKKIKVFSLFLFLFLISIFISKGSGAPFGFLIRDSFSLFPYLGVFRNPFEKFGILIPFASAYLAGYGFLYTIYSITGRYRNLWKIGVALLIFGFLIYHWPYFTGNIFGNLKYSSSIKVPKEYDDVSRWFKNNGSPNPRIFHFPFAIGDGIVYNWDHGYWGLEPSQLFFPGSSISHYTGYDLVDAQYKALALAARSRDAEYFKTLVDKFSINYIVIHKDVDFNIYRNDSLSNIESFIASLPFIEKKAILGKLEIYKVKYTQNNYMNVSLVSNPILLSGNLLYQSKLIANTTASHIYNTQLNSMRSTLQHQYVPDRIISTYSQKTDEKELLQEQPYVRTLPGSLLYPLIRLKEWAGLLGKEDFPIMLLKLQYANKRIVEAGQLVDLNRIDRASKTLEEYIKTIKEITPGFSSRIQSDILQYDTTDLFPLREIATRQKVLLQKIIQKKPFPALIAAQNQEKILEIASGLTSSFPIEQSLHMKIYHFTVSFSGEYKINLGNEWNTFFEDNSTIPIYINNTIHNVSVENAEGFIALSAIHFDAGSYDIGIPIRIQNSFPSEFVNQIEKNSSLISRSDNMEFEVKAVLSDNYIEYNMRNFSPEYMYLVTYDYWTIQGSNPRISFIQDIDSPPHNDLALTDQTNPEHYQFYWKNISQSFIPNAFARSARMRVAVSLWNNCIQIYQKQRSMCMQKNIYNNFNRPSDVQIKNIQITKFPENDISLLEIPRSPSSSRHSLQYIQVSPVKYELSLHNNTASVLELMETFHDGWVLKNSSGHIMNAPHVLVDSYANGWELSNIPNGKYTIEFVPQNDMSKGAYIGILSGLVGIGVLYIYTLWKRRQSVSQ